VRFLSPSDVACHAGRREDGVMCQFLAVYGTNLHITPRGERRVLRQRHVPTHDVTEHTSFTSPSNAGPARRPKA
jgi:hypothetical protein